MNTPGQIDPDAREFPYQQLAKLLRHRIERGDLKDLERLPSIAQFTDEYNLSVGTVRRALGILVGDGLLDILPQRGIFRACATEPATDTTRP
ncbi:winged helix-turn-helix domain-containing protein [Jiangella rhizosphaerae]|uniref:GntR family transcriptional regulator n=1 Tax=Jiangella rhizosphaerae TaxID=2293569 RepID=A0A418KWP7_9ACTN|nr:winged helix-turn-helix domain-containing protein [Jiangella rhizosphaerae]RIQ36977.1 GntR family transcriptional regulator [Jiangella rhizosphaerae]